MVWRYKVKVVKCMTKRTGTCFSGSLAIQTYCGWYSLRLFFFFCLNLFMSQQKIILPLGLHKLYGLRACRLLLYSLTAVLSAELFEIFRKEEERQRERQSMMIVTFQVYVDGASDGSLEILF